jgi:molybdopterin-containing oxidoreductase family membrane subunit
LVGGSKSLAQVTDDVCAPLERRATALWWLAFLASASVLALGTTAVVYQIGTGIGTWGLNRTVGWAFDITNFVFWIGIGHAGTLISAILFLFRQKWRTAVNRAAEAMTIFAVICAGLFPVIHMGRPWLFYWFIPYYPNTRGSLWVNFSSPLIWDFFAISTYFTISLVFWYLGLLPDLATVRERARPGWRRRLLALFSLGWNGSYRTWHRYEIVYLLLAGLATPLVVSVHSIVSTDFATATLPGWHTTIFPPYFVAGAIFSGMAMVLTLMLIARKVVHLEDYITPRHVDAMGKIVLATSGMVGLAYAIEFFTALQSADRYEYYAFVNRALGPVGWGFGIMLLCNVLLPQLLWLRRIRTNLVAVWGLALLINVGMWFERFIIITTSLERGFLPSSWADYAPTVIELATLAGSFGLFLTCFLLFCRFLPMIAVAEIKGVLRPPHSGDSGDSGDSGAPTPSRESGSESNGEAGEIAALSAGWHGPAHRPVLIGDFATEEEVLRATRAAREQGYRIVDVYTPYAVHGLDRAMGLRPSRLPWACFAAGLFGVTFALAFQFWTMAYDWPINVGGKPWNSLPAYVPVAFEVMVLLAGLGVVGAFLLRCRLFPGKYAAFPIAGNAETGDGRLAEKVPVPCVGVTDDRFVLVLENREG